MKLLARDELEIGGTRLNVDIISGLSWEDLVSFRAMAQIHERIIGDNVYYPVVREIKDWLIKRE